MRRLALPLLATVCCLSVAGGSTAAGCSPISCSPSQVPLSHGRLLAVRPNGAYGVVRVVDLHSGKTRWRLPDGQLAGNLLVNKDGSLLTWFNVATGARVADAVVQASGQFGLVGSSQDGTRAVLERSMKGVAAFAIVSPHGERVVKLDGPNWGFDALSGTKLFLLQYLRNGYEVRVYDLATNTLQAQPLKDANESARIAGTPWVRLSSSDGRYLFTLYITPNGKAMVHELDVRNAVARCIDLPGSGDFNAAASYTLTLSPDGRTLWAVSPGAGKVAAIDIAAAKVRDAFGFARAVPSSPVGGTAAISPHGDRLAVALTGDLWIVNTKHHDVVKQKPHVAIALGWSTDGKRLWLIGQRSRVTQLVA
jgi:hypothetical protein